MIISGAVQSFFLWLLIAKVHRNFFFFSVGLLWIVITSALVVVCSQFAVRNISRSHSKGQISPPQGVESLVTSTKYTTTPLPPSRTTQGVGYMLQCLNSRFKHLWPLIVSRNPRCELKCCIHKYDSTFLNKIILFHFSLDARTIPSTFARFSYLSLTNLGLHLETHRRDSISASPAEAGPPTRLSSAGLPVCVICPSVLRSLLEPKNPTFLKVTNGVGPGGQDQYLDFIFPYLIMSQVTIP